MKVIILAAGQGTRLRPLTDKMPKCMVEVNQKSIIENVLDTIVNCGISEKDIYIITGYKTEVLEHFLKDREVNYIHNDAYDSTNMVCSFMCAKELIQKEQDVIVSYGDIIYEESVFEKILNASSELSVIVDDGWYDYWKERCDDPLDDAESLMFDENDYLTEIGQKTTVLSHVQSQYIGLMRFKGDGAKQVLDLCEEAERRSVCGKTLWRTERDYSHMYMTDMLQGLIDEGSLIKALHINRGWYEVDCIDDLKIAEQGE